MCGRSEDPYEGLIEKQRKLDERGNDIKATKRESAWAKSLLAPSTDIDLLGQDRIKDPLKMLLHGHVTKMMRGRFTASKVLTADQHKLLEAQRAFEKAMKAMGDFTLENMGKLLNSEAGKFKQLVDYWGGELIESKESLLDKHSEVRRYTPEFADRGRKGRKVGILGRGQRDRHGGIAATAHRSMSEVDYFDLDVVHGRKLLEIDVESETAFGFQKKGAPFVGGASGTIHNLCLILENDKKVDRLKKSERQEREKLLAVYMASLVTGGHHSMSECLIAAKAHGYFREVPHPLHGDFSYDHSMKGLEDYLAKIGLKADRPLSREKEDEGKSDLEKKYNARRAEVEVLWEKWQGPLQATIGTAITRRLGAAATVAIQALALESNVSETEQKKAPAHWKLAMTELNGIADDIERAAILWTGQTRSHHRVLDGDEIIAEMGARPSTDKRFADLIKKAKEQRATFKSIASKPMDDPKIEALVQGYADKLADLEEACGSYQSYMFMRNPTLIELRNSIIMERRALRRMLDDQRNYTQAPMLTVEQALKHTRYAVPPDSSYLDTTRVVDDTTMSKLGAGGVNTVYSFTYSPPHDGEGERVLKPEPLYEGIGIIKDLGIDPERPEFGRRNVATRKAASLLGCADLVPDCTVVPYKDGFGLSMEKRPGKAIESVEYVPVDPKLVTRELIESGAVFESKGEWVTLQVKKGPQPILPGTKTERQYMKKCVDLQWLHALTGQVDAHSGNILVDVDENGDVTLTAVDQDFCFGKNSQSCSTLSIPQGGDKPDEVYELGRLGRNSHGLPPLIDRAMYTRVVAGTFWGTFTAGMGDTLAGDELEATRLRFAEIVQHAQKLNGDGLVIDDWSAPIDPAPTGYVDPPLISQFLRSGKLTTVGGKEYPNNYFARDIVKNDKHRLEASKSAPKKVEEDEEDPKD